MSSNIDPGVLIATQVIVVAWSESQSASDDESTRDQTQIYRGLWFSIENPDIVLGEVFGSREDVVAWARSLGADDVQIIEPPGTVAG